MREYRCDFTGRLVGAIGLSEYHIVTVRAESRGDAITKLYETYEHIHQLKIDGEYVNRTDS